MFSALFYYDSMIRMVATIHRLLMVATTHRLLMEAHGEYASIIRSCKGWFKYFKNNECGTEDNKRSSLTKKFLT